MEQQYLKDFYLKTFFFHFAMLFNYGKYFIVLVTLALFELDILNNHFLSIVKCVCN